MNTTWVFDVDGTLIDSLGGASLRPGARELLTHLRAEGHTVVLWSAGGAAYAKTRAVAHGVADLVNLFGDKDGRDTDHRYLTAGLLQSLDGVVFVDDRPEDMPIGADVIAVSPYLSDDQHDRGLRAALARAGVRA